MNVTVTCTGCSRQLRLPREVVGGSVKCPLCQAVFATRRVGDDGAEAVPMAQPVERPLPDLTPIDPPPAPAKKPSLSLDLDELEPVAPAASSPGGDEILEPEILDPIPLRDPTPPPPTRNSRRPAPPARPARRRPEPVEDDEEETPRSRPAATRRAKAPFTVFVRNDPDGKLKDVFQGRIDADGLKLWRGAGRVMTVAPGSACEYLGRAKLQVAIEGRKVELVAIHPDGLNDELARALNDYLNGSGEFVLPTKGVGAVAWMAVLPLAMPALAMLSPRIGDATGLVIFGFVGLFVAGIVAAVVFQRQWLPATRFWAAAWLTLAGYAVVGISHGNATGPAGLKPKVDPASLAWSAHAATNSGFAVDLPAQPASGSSRHVSFITETADTYRVARLADDTEFLLGTAWPTGQNNAPTPAGLAHSFRVVNGTLRDVRETTGEVAGLKAVTVTFRTMPGGAGRVSFIDIQGATAMLAVVTPRPALDEAIAAKFFDSVAIDRTTRGKVVAAGGGPVVNPPVVDPQAKLVTPYRIADEKEAGTKTTLLQSPRPILWADATADGAAMVAVADNGDVIFLHAPKDDCYPFVATGITPSTTSSIALAANGRYLVLVSGWRFGVIDVRARKALEIEKLGLAGLTAVAFSRDGGKIYAGTSGGQIETMQVVGGEVRTRPGGRPHFPAGSAVRGLAVSDGGELFVTTGDNAVYAFDPDQGTSALLCPKGDDDGPVGPPLLSARQSFLATRDDRGKLRVVSTFTGKPPAERSDLAGRGLAVTSTGKTILVASADGFLYAIDPATAKVSGRTPLILGRRGEVATLRLVDGDRKLLVAERSGQVSTVFVSTWLSLIDARHADEGAPGPRVAPGKEPVKPPEPPWTPPAFDSATAGGEILVRNTGDVIHVHADRVELSKQEKLAARGKFLVPHVSPRYDDRSDSFFALARRPRGAAVQWVVVEYAVDKIPASRKDDVPLLKEVRVGPAFDGAISLEVPIDGKSVYVLQDTVVRRLTRSDLKIQDAVGLGGKAIAMCADYVRMNLVVACASGDDDTELLYIEADSGKVRNRAVVRGRVSQVALENQGAVIVCGTAGGKPFARMLDATKDFKITAEIAADRPWIVRAGRDQFYMLRAGEAGRGAEILRLTSLFGRPVPRAYLKADLGPAGKVGPFAVYRDTPALLADGKLTVTGKIPIPAGLIEASLPGKGTAIPPEKEPVTPPEKEKESTPAVENADGLPRTGQIVFSPNGKHAAILYREQVTVVDAAAKKVLRHVTTHTPVSALALGDDLVLTGFKSTRRAVERYELGPIVSAPDPVHSLKSVTEASSVLIPSWRTSSRPMTDGKYLYEGGAGGFRRIPLLMLGGFDSERLKTKERISHVARSPDGKTIVIGGLRVVGGKAEAFVFSRIQPLRMTVTDSGETAAREQVPFVVNDKGIIVASVSDAIVWLDATDKFKELRRYPLKTPSRVLLALSPDQSTVCAVDFPIRNAMGPSAMHLLPTDPAKIAEAKVLPGPKVFGMVKADDRVAYWPGGKAVWLDPCGFVDLESPAAAELLKMPAAEK